jgi:hypothetical protein
MKTLVPLLSALAVLGATTVSQAASIDFTNTKPNNKADTSSGSVWTYSNAGKTGLTVTVTSSGGSITKSSDGLGVNGKGDTTGSTSGRETGTNEVNNTTDEINSPGGNTQSIQIDFSTEVSIDSITLTDIYASASGASMGTTFNWAAESGKWTIVGGTDDGQSGTFTGEVGRGTVRSPTLGNISLLETVDKDGFGILVISTTTKAAGSWFDEGAYKGFSIASVSFSPSTGGGVPELSVAGAGSAAFLFAGVGLLLSGQRRRQQVRPTST